MAVTVTKNPAFAFVWEPSYKGSPNIGQTAGTNVNHVRFLRLVSEDLNTNFQRDEANEVRSDAQTSGSIIVAASASGTLQLQYSMEVYDHFLAGIMYADDTDTAGAREFSYEVGWARDSAGSFTGLAPVVDPATPDTVTLDTQNDGLKFIPAGGLDAAPTPGDYVVVSGFGNRNIDTVWKVATVDALLSFTVENDTGEDNIAAYCGLTNGSANAKTSETNAISIKRMRGYLRNGLTERSYGLIRAYSATDPGNVGNTNTANLNANIDWTIFRGCIPTGIQLSVAPGQAGWTGSIPFLCADETVVNTDITVTGPYAGWAVADWSRTKQTSDNPLVNAIQSVLMVRLENSSGTSVRVEPTSLSVNISNNAQEIQALRNRGALAINQGTFSATVDMSILYEDAAYHKAMLDDDYYVVQFAIADADGNGQIWHFGKARLTSERPNPGKNNPVIQNLSFTVESGGEALRGGGAGRMIEIGRFYDPPVPAGDFD